HLRPALLLLPYTTLFRSDPHSRFTLNAGVSLPMPAFMAATRDKYISRGSVLMTWPTATWPTSAPGTPARDNASLMTVAPRSAGGTSFSAPPKSPMAVRAAATTTTSFMVISQAIAGTMPADVDKNDDNVRAATRRGGPCGLL